MERKIDVPPWRKAKKNQVKNNKSSFYHQDSYTVGYHQDSYTVGYHQDSYTVGVVPEHLSTALKNTIKMT